MAPQLTTTNGASRRALRSCKSRATISLPVPLSPIINTLASVGPAFTIDRVNRDTASDCPRSSVALSIGGSLIRKSWNVVVICFSVAFDSLVYDFSALKTVRCLYRFQTGDDTTQAK